MDIQIYEKIKNEFRKFYDKNIEKLSINYEELELDKDINKEINEGNKIIYKKIKIEKDCNINLMINLKENEYLVLFYEIELNNNVKFKYNIRGKINGILYHYLNVIHKERSISNIDERFSLYGKLYNISKINIPNGSKYSEGYLNEIILNNGKFLMSIPILNIEDETSKGFHGIKNIKLDSEQLFYLNSKGIKNEEVNEIIEKSILE